jgi:hypothetical protein
MLVPSDGLPAKLKSQSYERVTPTMNSDPMTVRTKVAVELGVIAVLTIAFLFLFPHRNPWLDVGLAGFALLCIGASEP